MTDLKLWRSKRNALPETIQVDGRAFPIRADFRTILKIFAILHDPEVIETHKAERLLHLFFVDEIPTNWEECFGWFVRCGDAPSETASEPIFDYDFDAPEIYASFLSLYRIDLFEADLHWWQFSALLDGCFACRCALSEKIRIRTLDVSKCDNLAEAQRAKDRAQIPARIGQGEQLTMDQILERLARGEPVADLLGA